MFAVSRGVLLGNLSKGWKMGKRLGAKLKERGWIEEIKSEEGDNRRRSLARVQNSRSTKIHENRKFHTRVT